MSISNILGADGKIIPGVLPNPYPHPPVATGLGAVLAVSGDGTTLPMTNVGSIGCSNIAAPFGSILAFNSDLIGGGALGNLGILPANNLSIKGAQTKGSMLVGNGTSTAELIVPVAPVLPDGSVLILDSTTPLGVRWGGESGDINTITPGNNIEITGMSANPIVALKAPLTSTLNMGAVAITDSAGAVGVSGQVLTAGTGGQTLWGTNGVSSITAGTNISVTGTASVPIVNLQAPLTSTLNMGAVAITDSAGAVGVSGQVLTAGTGGQTLWGTNGVSSITAGTNISITGTASVPVVNLQNPLTATLNAGAQNIHGTSTQFTLTNGGSQANATATLGFTSADASVATTKSVLFKTGLTCQTATNAVVVSPTSVVKSGTTPLAITSGSSEIVIQGLGGLADGIQINQLSGQGTTLKTSLSNVKYYPDYYLSNNDSIIQVVPNPQVIHQRLTLNNLGLTNTSLWSDYGGLIAAGYSAFFRDSNNNIWLAEEGTGNIQVCDNPPTSTLYNITMTGTLTGGATRVNVFYEQGGYVFIGGNFSTINGNAQPQYGIARVALSTYTEDPMYDSLNTEAGVGGGEVYDITDVAGELDIVGSFTTTNTGNTALRMLTITNPYVAGGGSQTFIESYGGANSIIYTILFEPTYGRVYYGGAFSGVGINIGATGCNFIAYWDIALTGWNVVGGNVFNGNVNKIIFTGHTELYVVGGFSIVASTYNCYLDLISTTPIDSNIILSTPPTFQQAFHLGGNLAVMDGTTFYREDAATIWTSLGVPSVGTTITGINYDTTSIGDWKVIYNDYAYIRSHSIQPHSCEFQGSFKYDNTTYTKYTIVPRNVSQQFIADNGCSFWSIIGAGVGTFS